MSSRFGLLVLALGLSLPLSAMEALDDGALATVTGQAQGLRYTSEYDARIDSITYIDDDGLDGGRVGTLSLSPVRIYTQTNRPVQVDLEVKDVNGRKALVFTNRDLPVEVDIGSLAINGVSLGGFGQGNFNIGQNDVFVSTLYAGGHDGNGLTLDLDIPSSMSYDTYYENDGTRLTTTVDFGDPRDPSGGGLLLRDITFDLEGEGLRIGVPTTEGGNINFYNVRIGDDVLNSTAMRNISIQPGGYLLLKNAKGANEIGIEMDLLVTQNSSFDWVYITGPIDGTYPSANVFEMSANVRLLSDFAVKGLRMNVDGDRGLVFDFDQQNASHGVSANVLASDFTLQRSDRVGLGAAPVSLGSLDVQMNLTNASYLQIQGH